MGALAPGEAATRITERKFVIEGSRLLEDALSSGQKPHLVLLTTEWMDRHPQLLVQLLASSELVETVSSEILAHCSDVEAPQGILAVVPMASIDRKPRSDLTLILDRLADPGNLGTILRTAVAAEVEMVYLTKGTIDAYNPKVVRGGMGAHFHLPIQEGLDRSHHRQPGGYCPMDRRSPHWRTI